MINRKIISELILVRIDSITLVQHYGERDFTRNQFMGLRNITHGDKLWVAFRLLRPERIRLAAADIAESVLHIYENACPGDMRPRQAIEAARSGNADAASHAANAASHAAYAVAYAARAAGYAARAAYAANAAAYAAYAADAASNSANCADNKMTQEKLIRKIILKYWKD